MMGCQNLYVVTDHSVLVTVLGDLSLADVDNPRLARIKEKMLWWQFKILHTLGKKQLLMHCRGGENILQPLQTVSDCDQ